MAKIRHDANREEQRSIEEQCCLFVHDTLKKVSPVCFHQSFKQTSTSRGPLGHHPTIQSHLGRGSCRARAKSSDALPRGEIGNNLRRWSVLKFDGAPLWRPATEGEPLCFEKSGLAKIWPFSVQIWPFVLTYVPYFWKKWPKMSQNGRFVKRCSDTKVVHDSASFMKFKLWVKLLVSKMIQHDFFSGKYSEISQVLSELVVFWKQILYQYRQHIKSFRVVELRSGHVNCAARVVDLRICS